MVIAQRLLYIEGAILAGFEVYLATGCNPATGRVKLKVKVGSVTGVVPPAARVLLLRSLTIAKQMCEGHTTVDRGHRYSNGTACAQFWVTPRTAQGAGGGAGCSEQEGEEIVNMEESEGKYDPDEKKHNMDALAAGAAWCDPQPGDAGTKGEPDGAAEGSESSDSSASAASSGKNHEDEEGTNEDEEDEDYPQSLEEATEMITASSDKIHQLWGDIRATQSSSEARQVGAALEAEFVRLEDLSRMELWLQEAAADKEGG